jgi:hypothetical protein
MERSALNSSASRSHETLSASEHLLRRAPRERQKKNALGTNAALDQMRDTIDERSRFSRSSAGNDEQWAVAMCRCSELLVVQIGGELSRVPRRLARARRVDTWLLGHRAGIYVEARSLGAAPRFIPHRKRCPSTER